MELFDTVKTLYEIDRTLLGKGFEESLDFLGQGIPLEIHSLESGTACGTWIVPDEWVLNSARLILEDGTVLVDKKIHPLCVSHYSNSVKKILSFEALKPFLRTGKTSEARPLEVAYYNDGWSFAVTPEEYERLSNESKIGVEIESDFRKGRLSIGSVFCAGRSKKTILIDAILSFPSLANNLTGAAIAQAIAAYLSEKSTQYSYRILFTPETIGPVSITHFFPHLFNEVVGGMVLINLGRGQHLNYKLSKEGLSPVDRNMRLVATQEPNLISLLDYDLAANKTCHEKVYNAPGSDIPMGRLSGLIPGGFEAYDTSLDMLSFINSKDLDFSFSWLCNFIDKMEANTPLNAAYISEPFLSGFGLENIFRNSETRFVVDTILNYADGKTTIAEIKRLVNADSDAFDDTLMNLEKKNLVFQGIGIHSFHTDRLFLRELLPQDASDKYRNWLADERVTQHLESRDDTVEKISEYIDEHLQRKDSLLFGIFDKKTLAHIGNTKLEPIDWKCNSAIFGIMIGEKEYWNKGLATEALNGLAEYSRTRLGLKRIDLGVLKQNVAAIRSYEKCGFVVKKETSIWREHYKKWFDEIHMSLDLQGF